MNKYRIDDDFFSPVRPVTSDSESSDASESLSNLPNSDMSVSASKSIKNKYAPRDNEISFTRETNELESFSSKLSFASKRSEASSLCSPVSKRDSSNPKRSSKVLISDSNKLKSEKEKVFKYNVIKREISQGHPKKQECEQRKSTSDLDSVKSKSKQNLVKKTSSRPTSLLLKKKEISKSSASKDITKEKNISQSSKDMYNLHRLKSEDKHPEKKLIDNSLDAQVIKNENSGEKLTDLSSCNSLIYGLSNKKSDTKDQPVENTESISNFPVYSPFEISVEKIVHDVISSECDKIRQNIYAQQMSFYRELNKVKEEMEKQHLATTEHMFKIIEELMRVNFSLKSVSLH